MSEWIKREDSLPNRLDRVICYEPNAKPHVFEWKGFGVIECHSITHWMPIPEPPKNNIEITND